jgi:hypothetical protein
MMEKRCRDAVKYSPVLTSSRQCWVVVEAITTNGRVDKHGQERVILADDEALEPLLALARDRKIVTGLAVR